MNGCRGAASARIGRGVQGDPTNGAADAPGLSGIGLARAAGAATSAARTPIPRTHRRIAGILPRSPRRLRRWRCVDPRPPPPAARRDPSDGQGQAPSDEDRAARSARRRCSAWSTAATRSSRPRRASRRPPTRSSAPAPPSATTPRPPAATSRRRSPPPAAQERLQLRRMADASLALAERRADDLKASMERARSDARRPAASSSACERWACSPRPPAPALVAPRPRRAS